MSVPKYYEMIKPFLKHLGDGKEHQLKELKKQLQKDFRLSKEELSELLRAADRRFLRIESDGPGLI